MGTLPSRLASAHLLKTQTVFARAFWSIIFVVQALVLAVQAFRQMPSSSILTFDCENDKLRCRDSGPRHSFLSRACSLSTALTSR